MTTEKRISSITYIMPDNQKAKNFNYYLCKILDIKHTQQSINLSKETSPIYTPTTNFILKSNISQPNIVFANSEIPPLIIGNMLLSNHEQSTYPTNEKKYKISFTNPTDEIGPYIQGTIKNQKYYWLTMEEFARRVKDTQITLDHTGINIPTKAISKDTWETLISQLGKEAIVYDYPAEPWPFIIPATPAEQTGKKIDIRAQRGPKFELVYDEYTTLPLIQIALGSNLSKEAVHKLFPGPYAETFPNLADFFRSIYIKSPWEGLIIRIDLGYASDQTEDGLLKYLITEGKRR